MVGVIHRQTMRCSILIMITHLHNFWRVPAVCVLCENGKKYYSCSFENIHFYAVKKFIIFFIMQVYQKLLYRDVEMYYFILNFAG